MAIVLILIICAFLGTMLLAILLPMKPSILRLVSPFVCPPGTVMEIHKFQASYHRPGEHGLEVVAVGAGMRVDIKTKTLLLFWGICCLVTAPLAAYLTDLILQFF